MISEINIVDNCIFFKKYEFKHSSVCNDTKIDAKQINFACVNNVPLFLVVNNNELLFFDDSYKESLVNYLRINSVPMSEHFDIWLYLYNYDENDKSDLSKGYRSTLFSWRYSETEIKKILSDFRFNLFHSDNGGYTDTYMLLKSYVFQSKKTYWDIMKISIDGLKRYYKAINSPFKQIDV